MQNRNYQVAGIGFTICLDAPLSFMDYSEVVSARIADAKEGRPLVLPDPVDGALRPIRSTRAQDRPYRRTFVQSREELPEVHLPGQLDMSQYEPFRTEQLPEEAFRVTAHKGIPQQLSEALANGMAQLIQKVEEEPRYDIYRYDGCTYICFLDNNGKAGAILRINGDFDTADVFFSDSLPQWYVLQYLNNSVMISYTAFSATRGRALIHASSVLYKGRAVLFLGKSGTGKSTHSRLWLENIEGCELLNDDNPVIGIKDGIVQCFGSPWSGKTPCYRNTYSPIGGIVKINRSADNHLDAMNGIFAYADILSSCSSLRWEKTQMDPMRGLIEKIAMETHCYCMHCNQDPQAAFVCRDGIFTA